MVDISSVKMIEFYIPQSKNSNVGRMLRILILRDLNWLLSRQ